ncbi:MAG: polysaccharide pyruvyl transferase family protein [Rhodospirillales bacterium]|nr:polysaccharide pyruvyl transferase family protein [Rhodospirillales bacterium]
MKLHYFNKDTNFGDAMNVWLWERLLPGCLDEDGRVRFGGIGTILNASLPPAERWIVFTSGVGYPPLPPNFGSPAWSVIAVRGPLSAAVLGLPADAAVTDGAMLVAGLPEYAALPEKRRDGIVFVPHHRAEPSGAWRAAAARAGIEYLSPLTESREVIARLRRARLVLADAMHAAILADAMRVPWIPLATSPAINTFKWLDWALSMKVPYAPVTLSPPSLASRVHNATLRIRGEHFAFEPDDAAQVLARFRRSNAIRQQAWWRRARRFGQRLVGRAERQLQAPYLARWRRVTDDVLLERSAQALAAAAAGPSYLSDDAVFRDRLDALQSRLEAVRAAAMDARLGLLPASAQFPDPAGEVRHVRLHAMARGESPV